MFASHPVKLTLICLCVAWLARHAGFKVPLLRLAALVGVVVVAAAAGPALASALAGGGLTVLGLGALAVGAVASHRIFSGQREKLFGKPQADSSPKRRNEARRD